jgi:hypothetical protein
MELMDKVARKFYIEKPFLLISYTLDMVKFIIFDTGGNMSDDAIS